MASLLLAIIYISFISLGLPDSLLGSAWPVVQIELGAPLSAAGLVSTIIMAGTILSSLLSDRTTRRFGAGPVNAVSTAMTAVALFGFSISNSVLELCLWSIPYGLGAGAIDAALNNYVALHFAARHMSWLHCFWGLGASVSPYIMTYCLTSDFGWRTGYHIVFVIQLILSVFMFISIPLWKKPVTQTATDGTEISAPLGVIGSFKIRGVPHVLLAFFAYCALEATAGLWATSYFVEHRGTDPETAAAFASLFFLGITVGRFLNGFLADRFSDKTLVRVGSAILVGGLVLIMIPTATDLFALAGLIITGLGCAPIYPCIIHSTPAHFGRENSQAIVGIQMASAYTGCALMPPVFGLIGDYIGVGLYPFYMALFALLMIFMTERLNRMFEKTE